MRRHLLALIAGPIIFSGCGIESAGTAAGVAKLQAEQATQSKESADSIKADLDAAKQISQERLKQADQGESN